MVADLAWQAPDVKPDWFGNVALKYEDAFRGYVK